MTGLKILKKLVGLALFVSGFLGCMYVIGIGGVFAVYSLERMLQYGEVLENILFILMLLLILAIPSAVTILGMILLHDPKKKHEKSAKV